MFRNMAYASVTAGSAVLLLILNVFAARTLGEVEFGKFSFALALGAIFETLMDFGLHQVTIRAVARDKSRATEMLHHTLAIKLVWMVGAFSALVITATWLRPEWDVRIACYLIGGSLVLRSYMLTIRGVLQGLEHFGWDSVVVGVDRTVLLTCGMAALLSGTGLRGLVIAFITARAISLGLTAWLTNTTLGGIGLKFDRDVWRDLHTTAVPFGLFLVALNLYSYIDSVMLGKMRGDAETGLYNSAYRTYEGLAYAASLIAAVLTPRLASLFVRDRRAHRRVALLGIAAASGMALAVGVIAYLVADPLIVFVYGAEYLPSAAPFRLLCWGLVFVFSIWVLHAITISINRERLLFQTAIVGLIVNVGVNLYVIPRIGMNGAAIATVIGEGVSMVILLFGIRSVFRRVT